MLRKQTYLNRLLKVHWNGVLPPTNLCALTYITPSTLTTYLFFYLMLFCFSKAAVQLNSPGEKKTKLGATYMRVIENTQLRAQICEHLKV